MTPAGETRLRLLSVPPLDPPYDDEVVDQPPVVEGSLALAFPPVESMAYPLRLVPPAEDSDADAERTARVDLPDPRPWVHRLSQAVIEVLAGARAAGQLSRFASFEVLLHLERATGRFASRRPGTPTRRPTVTSVHVCEPADGVAEACAVIDTGVRRRALALRLEGVDGRWRCTALTVG